MSLTERWGEGILRAGGIVLVIYLLDRYFEEIRDHEVYSILFLGFLIGWFQGTKRINREQPKTTTITKRIISFTYSSFSLCVLIVCIYQAAKEAPSSWVPLQFIISFFLAFAVVSIARWAIGCFKPRS